MSTLQKVTRAAYGAASKLLELQLRGAGDEGDDESAEPTDAAPFLQQLGIAVLPVVVSTLRALVDQDGDEPRVDALWDKAHAPTDLESGETRVYAVGAITRVVRLLTTRIVVEAPEIRLGAAATKKVNREGDPILPGTLGVVAGPPVTALGVTTTPVAFTFTPPAGGGAPASLVLAIAGPGVVVTVVGTASITLGGVTGPGSTKVRAED